MNKKFVQQEILGEGSREGFKGGLKELGGLNFQKMNGLIPAVIQDAKTNKVLMLGFMNEEALERTQKEGKVTFYSRTKKRLWTKGETSGNSLRVKEIMSDCDQDVLLIKVDPVGPTCHRETESCFGAEDFLQELMEVIKARRKFKPKGSYTTRLFEEGMKKIGAKVMEEAEEVTRAGREESKQRVTEEAGDLIYHLLVLLVEREASLKEVIRELAKRRQ